MPKRTTIIGIRLRCEACNAMFAIGINGIEPTRKRVMSHMKECPGRIDVRPVDTKFSRPKGLTYTGHGGNTVEIVYDGKDWNDFWNEIMTASREFLTVMSPKWELTLIEEV